MAPSAGSVRQQTDCRVGLAHTDFLYRRGIPMKSFHRITFTTLAAIGLLSLSACAGMSTQDTNTAIGAGAGAVDGAVLTGGTAVGTVGGAAVGGIIGHEVSGD